MPEDEHFSLVEIADLLNTPSTTIRYRARLFQEFLHSIRRPKQFRGVRYPATDLAVFQLVDRLYREERSTGDIRRALEEARDGRVIDAPVSDEDRATSPLALVSHGPETVARILRDGIAQAMSPLGESNRQIAESLSQLKSLLETRSGVTDPGELGEVTDRLSRLEDRARVADEVPRLRERIVMLEQENRRLHEQLEQAHASIPRRLIRRAMGLF
jgi:hypothetical protein